jgi:hypothetical protein
MSTETKSSKRKLARPASLSGTRSKSLPLVDAIMSVLDEVDGKISTRQMYYQLALRGIVKPKQVGYDQVQRLLVRLRWKGFIPPSRICDRTRRKHQRSSWDGLADILKNTEEQYRRDYWADQPEVVYIGLEKQALEGVVADVCDKYGVGLFVCRGYPSYSLLYDWAEEIRFWNHQGKEVNIFYLGDFDPTGVDIDRAIEEALRKFGAKDFFFERIGIFGEDIDRYNLLPLPIKKEARAQKFMEQHGTRAAELDALPPRELRRRIEDAITSCIDQDRWERMEAIEAQEQITLRKFVSTLEVADGPA